MREIIECNRCDELVSNRTRISHGWGKIPATFMFIGEAPGTKGADVTGRAFTSAHSCKIFQQIVDRSEITDFYVTNVVKCRPKDNRKPTMTEIINCSYIINEELSEVKPRIIVCLGKTSFEYIINLYGLNTLTRYFRHCFYHSNSDPKILVSIHPSIITDDELNQLTDFLKRIKDDLSSN